MISRLEAVVVVLMSANLVLILELARRRQLREKYALLWLAVGTGGLALALSRRLLDHVASFLGVSYGPSALFLFSTLFLVLVAAHLSWEVSRLEERTRRLAEEVALMRVRYPSEEDTPPAVEPERREEGAGDNPASGTPFTE